MICEAGVVLLNAQDEAANRTDCFRSLGAEGTCVIGSNLGSNAGGTGALAYGVARSRARPVVLAGGRVCTGCEN